jgi:ComF family protein
VRPVDELFRGGVCGPCWRSLPDRAGDRCDVCDEPLAAAGAARCGRCLIHPPAFDSLRAATPYRGAARSILLAFKFRGADYLGPRLADVCLERLAAGFPGPPDEIVAVPATARARRRRGYHPAEVLAQAIARRLGGPFEPRRIRKVRETARQSGLALERRRANVRGAFRVGGSPTRSILLVDDVATSGWTARECAAALVKAGAKRVDVWCFARASRDDVDRDELSTSP